MVASFSYSRFLSNDLEHAPFGLGILRGITPVRLAVVLLICLVQAIALTDAYIGVRGLTVGALQAIGSKWMRYFVATLPMVMLVIAADMRSARSPARTRIAAFAIAVVIGSAALATINAALAVLLGIGGWRQWPIYPLIPVFFVHGLLIGAVLCAILFFARRERDASCALQGELLRRAANARQLAEARLHLLFAQIEPHFLFNSLASVKRLYERQPAEGRMLLRNLGRYLRVAMDGERRKETTLGEELAVAKAYLEVFQLRMGPRLHLRMDIPPEITGALVPPLVIGTLVENSVKHGLGPSASGGNLKITAQRSAGQVVIEVADDGIGFREKSGAGMGLANSRARLEALYGNAAFLDIAKNAEGGVTATVRVPYRTSQSADEPLVSAETEVQAPPSSRPENLLARVWRVLTWNHWMWATAVGLALSAWAQIPALTGAGLRDPFGLAWAVAAVWMVGFSYLFMLAIALAEACSKPALVSSGWTFALPAIGVSLLCAGLVWMFPRDQPGTRTQDARKIAMQRFVAQSPGFDRRRAQLSNFGMPMVLYGILGTMVYVWLRNARLAAGALTAAEVERAEAGRRLAASQLASAQVRVDPSLVLERLAEIERTYDLDREHADAMLEQLIALLRGAIPRLRAGDSE